MKVLKNYSLKTVIQLVVGQIFRINSLFALIPELARSLEDIKKGETIQIDNFSFRVTSSGDISNQILDDLEAVDYARKVIDLTITTNRNNSFLEGQEE